MKLKSWMVFSITMVLILYFAMAAYGNHKSIVFVIGGIAMGMGLMEAGAWFQRLKDVETAEENKVDL